jgi:ABC-type antimicrobial peptide transport system permease subunit
MARSVLQQSLVLVGAGVRSGIIAAAAATHLIRSFLYGVGASDIATYVTVILLLGFAALAASYFPAHRAARVDPMIALRHE